MEFCRLLLVELTIILLYGQLKLDFVLNGETRTTALQFNAVMQHVYSEAVQGILDAIDGTEHASTNRDFSRSSILVGWPLKFRNFSIIYMPEKSQLLDGVYWNEIRDGFGRELAPAVAMLLTDRHIVLIAEEKSSRWFSFRHHTKYGAIITYFPLNRLTDFRIHPHSRFSILELQGHSGQGGEKLEIMFRRTSVRRCRASWRKRPRLHSLQASITSLAVSDDGAARYERGRASDEGVSLTLLLAYYWRLLYGFRCSGGLPSPKSLEKRLKGVWADSNLQE